MEQKHRRRWVVSKSHVPFQAECHNAPVWRHYEWSQKGAIYAPLQHPIFATPQLLEEGWSRFQMTKAGCVCGSRRLHNTFWLREISCSSKESSIMQWQLKWWWRSSFYHLKITLLISVKPTLVLYHPVWYNCAPKKRHPAGRDLVWACETIMHQTYWFISWIPRVRSITLSHTHATAW